MCKWEFGLGVLGLGYIWVKWEFGLGVLGLGCIWVKWEFVLGVLGLGYIWVKWEFGLGVLGLGCIWVKWEFVLVCARARVCEGSACCACQIIRKLIVAFVYCLVQCGNMYVSVGDLPLIKPFQHSLCSHILFLQLSCATDICLCQFF